MKKKLLSILLSVAMVASLCACGASNDATDNAAQTEETTDEATDAATDAATDEATDETADAADKAGVMPAIAKEDIKVGVIHIGDPATGSGYSSYSIVFLYWGRGSFMEPNGCSWHYICSANGDFYAACTQTVHSWHDFRRYQVIFLFN